MNRQIKNEDILIGFKELRQNLTKIYKTIKDERKTFSVVRNSKLVFRIVPVNEKNEKKYSLKDFEKLQFKDKNHKLSHEIDKILYKK